MAFEDVYSFKMLITLFPFLFSIIGFLGYLSNGEIINSIFFFFGLLLTILTGYIFKVLKIGTKQSKKINQICGIILPNYLFKISTISLNQLFYGFVLTYIFGMPLINKTTFKNFWYVLSFIVMFLFWIFDMFYFNGNGCSDINEIFFGFVLGFIIALLMLSVKMRYYGEYKPYTQQNCNLNGNNKYVCKEGEDEKKQKNINKANMVQEYNKRKGLPSGSNFQKHFNLIMVIFIIAAFLLFAQMHSSDYRNKGYIFVAALIGLVVLCFMYFVKITTMQEQSSDRINIDEIMGIIIIMGLIIGTTGYYNRSTPLLGPFSPAKKAWIMTNSKRVWANARQSARGGIARARQSARVGIARARRLLPYRPNR